MGSNPTHGAVDRVSASTVKALMSCQRRVWFARVAGHAEPGTEAQHLGSSVHALLEADAVGETRPTSYTGRGGDERPLHSKAPDIADHAAGVLAVELHGAVDVQVEQLALAPCGPLPYLGYVDLVVDGRVYDHKTRSRKKAAYIPTDANIADDLQMQSYAYALNHTDPPAAVLLCHLNHLTKPGPRTKERSWTARAWATWDTIADTWTSVFLLGSVILAWLHTVDDPDEVPHGAPRACWAYGQRCPHWDRCSATQTKQQKWSFVNG